MICVLAFSVAAAQPGPAGDSDANAISLTIDEAVEIGTSRSFRLQRSRRSEQIARERVRGIKAALGPRFDVNLGAEQSQRYYKFQGTYDYNQATPQFDTTLGANASYEFDVSGIRKRQLQQVRLSQDSTSIEAAQTTVDVAAEIKANYVRTLRSQQQVSVDSRYLNLIDDLIARARLAQPSAVGFLESERSNAALALEQSRQNAELTVSYLRQSLRLNDDRPLVLTSELPPPPSLPSQGRLLEIAYGNRSDLKQSEIRLKQARIAKVQATDSRRPTLRIAGFASQAFTGDTVLLRGADHGRTKSIGALVSFALPILSYDGGQLDSNRNIARIQAEQAMADAEEAKERAKDEIDQEVISLKRARDRLSKLPDVEQARQSLFQAEQQMLTAGGGEAAGLLAQVTNARQNWKASVMSMHDALSTYYTNYYQLQRSLGTEIIE